MSTYADTKAINTRRSYDYKKTTTVNIIYYIIAEDNAANCHLSRGITEEEIVEYYASLSSSRDTDWACNEAVKYCIEELLKSNRIRAIWGNESYEYGYESTAYLDEFSFLSEFQNERLTSKSSQPDRRQIEPNCHETLKFCGIFASLLPPKAREYYEPAHWELIDEYLYINNSTRTLSQRRYLTFVFTHKTITIWIQTLITFLSCETIEFCKWSIIIAVGEKPIKQLRALIYSFIRMF